MQEDLIVAELHAHTFAQCFVYECVYKLFFVDYVYIKLYF